MGLNIVSSPLMTVSFSLNLKNQIHRYQSIYLRLFRIALLKQYFKSQDKKFAKVL